MKSGLMGNLVWRLLRSSLPFTLILYFSVSCFGVESKPQSNQAIAGTQTPSSKVFGTLDVRAEYTTKMGMWDTSNYAQLGYQFNPDFKINWYQSFDSNLFDPRAGEKHTGLHAVLDQGFLRTRIKNIWQSGPLSFSYESRIYVPTWQPEIDQGNVTRFYNAFFLKNKINDKLSISVAEVLMPEIFKTAGTAMGANPYFENRIYLIASYTLTDKWTLDFPILFYQDKYRDAGPTTKNSGAWTGLVYIWPELDYAVNDYFTAGLSYYSANLIQSDFKGINIGQGLEKGTVQWVGRASF